MPTTPVLGATYPTPLDPATADVWGSILNVLFLAFDGEFGTRTVAQNFADLVLSQPILKDYGEEIATLSIAAGAATWDFVNGNHAKITLTANTTLTIINPTASGDLGSGIIFITQDGSGSRTFTWPGSVVSPPTVTSTASRSDVYLLWTIDGGSKYFVQTLQVGVTL